MNSEGEKMRSTQQEDDSFTERAVRRFETPRIFEWQTRERSARYAELFEELFPGTDASLKKLTAEQATKIDTIIRGHIKAGRAQTLSEALDMLDRSGDFRIPNQVTQEEGFRLPIVQFFSSVRRDVPETGVEHIRHFRHKLAEGSRNAFTQQVKIIGLSQLESLLQQEAFEEFVYLLQVLNVLEIEYDARDFSSIPPNAFSDIRTKNGALQILTHSIRSTDHFERFIEQFERLGILSSDEISEHENLFPFLCDVAEEKFGDGSWEAIIGLKRWLARIQASGLATEKDIVASSRLRERAHDRLLEIFGDGSPSQLIQFDNALADYSSIGLVDVSTFHRDPDLCSRAVKRCSEVLGDGDAARVLAFFTAVHEFTSRHIISEDEVMHAVRPREKILAKGVEIFGNGGHVQSFREYAKEIARYGIVSERDFGRHPAIRQAAETAIERALSISQHDSGEEYREMRNAFIELHIFTQKEIDELPAVKTYKERIIS